MARPRGAPGLVPSQAPATDLTAARGLAGLSGARIIDVGNATLDAGATLIKRWAELEPLVQTLTEKVKRHAEAEEVQGEDAARLLNLCASVSQKVGAAATNVLRASEGQARLALLLAGPKAEKPSPTKMSEKQLAAVVLEAAKQIAADTGSCPVCTVTHEVKPVNGTAAEECPL